MEATPVRLAQTIVPRQTFRAVVGGGLLAYGLRRLRRVVAIRPLARLILALAQIGAQGGGFTREPCLFRRVLAARRWRLGGTLLWLHRMQASRRTAARQGRCLAPAGGGWLYAAARPSRRCRSSVVEHPLGKGEVVSSILPGSTMVSLAFLVTGTNDGRGITGALCRKLFAAGHRFLRGRSLEQSNSTPPSFLLR